jgi:hypothetical protein
MSAIISSATFMFGFLMTDIAVSMLIGRTMRWGLYDLLMGPYFLVKLAVALCGATMLLRAFRQVYFRIYPGRLDLLYYTVFRRAPQVTSFDLGSPTIIVDDVQRVSFLDWGAQQLQMNMTLARDWDEYANALLRGARSSKLAGPAPDDALVG